jgi:hypothetical protein
MLTVHLPLVTRAAEEAMLRAYRPGEEPCMFGSSCKGMVDVVNGHDILPSFMNHTCILCLRAKTLAEWLDGLGETKTTIIQPYRNATGPGEYRESACIIPMTTRFDGITDPIVRYDPDGLAWKNQRIIQYKCHYEIIPSVTGKSRVKKQYMMRQLPYLDITLDILYSGLFCHVVHEPTPIQRHLRTALWSNQSADMDSSWIHTIFPLHVSPSVETARTFILWNLTAVISTNPILVAALNKRHRWNAFVDYVHDVAMYNGCITGIHKYLRLNQEWVWVCSPSRTSD